MILMYAIQLFRYRVANPFNQSLQEKAGLYA